VITHWIFLEKLTVAQLVKKFPNFMESEGSGLCSQKSAVGRSPEPPESSPHLHTLFSDLP